MIGEVQVREEKNGWKKKLREKLRKAGGNESALK